ncbi:MAG: alpha/beta fold hydrolase [Candidatus Moranbacteria bacterium]|nr:alpha/beta fold hydrolase [Candidatus Moranbacteria bacterium]
MPKTNKNKLLVFFLALGLVFSFRSASAKETINIDTDTTWTKETPNLVFDKPVVIGSGATLTVEKGVRIVFQVNPDQPFNPAGFEVLDGRLVANGTREENIVFTSPDDGFNLLFRDNDQTSFLRYVTLENGGFIPTVEGSGDLVPRYPLFEIDGGNIHIENSKFANSRFKEMIVADVPIQDAEGNYVYDENDNLAQDKAQAEVINSNFSNQTAVDSQLDCWAYDENTDEDYINQECLKRVYLKDDWFGDVFGPTLEDDDIQKGYLISGFHYLDAWKTNIDIINPVVVIPGIMGSAEVDGIWQIDPILHIYDDLLESLEENGYSQNENLFEFPYDWRNSNIDSAQKLQTKIEAIRKQTKISKVDVVAHSMGGLVARAYIEGDDYGNDVDKMITLGTPHHGSPESYLKWEAGEGFFTMNEGLLKHHFEMEALHSGYINVFEYIQERILSVGELLPDYDYLFDVSKNSMRSYADKYPRNEFLEKLNASTNLAKLEGVDFTNIVGALDDIQSTITSLRVVESEIEDRWVDGMPENFYDNKTDRGLVSYYGDGTVPESSAGGIVADNKLESKAAHNDLPTVSQCAIVSLLIQKQECISVNKTHIPNILMFNIFSPIDIQIIAPDGKRVGKDLETGEIYNEIEGAYYSGYGTENEFLTIPNPLDGEYKVLTQGTGNGDFKIETVKISEQADGSAQEATKDLVGTAVSGSLDEFTVNTAELVTVDDEDQDDSDAVSESESSSDSSDDDDSSSDSDSSDSKEHNNNSSAGDGVSVAIANSQGFSVNDGRDVVSSYALTPEAGNGNWSNIGENNQNKKDEKVILSNWGIIEIISGIFVGIITVFIFRKRLMFILSKKWF